MVQTIRLTLFEHLHPLFLVGRRIARFRETAVFNGASQVKRTSVNIDLPPFNADFAQTKRNGNLPSIIIDFLRIKLRIELIPQFGILRIPHIISILVDNDLHHVLVQMGNDLLTPDVDSSLQLNTTCYTVPVTLGLVCHGMGVLTYADILNAIIDTDGYLVTLTWDDIRRHVILVGC